MEFHPGGEDEMMRGAGIDGTALFDEVPASASTRDCCVSTNQGEIKDQ